MYTPHRGITQNLKGFTTIFPQVEITTSIICPDVCVYVRSASFGFTLVYTEVISCLVLNKKTKQICAVSNVAYHKSFSNN